MATAKAQHLFAWWSQQWDTEVQQQALRIAPVLGKRTLVILFLDESRPTPGQ